jgi:hypothetical protein
MPHTSSDISRFPVMLLSPILSESGETGRLEVIRLELRPPPGAIHSVRTMAHRFLSRGSPATTPKQSLDDVQVGYGICASCAPHRDWSSGHLFPFPYSPTCHPVTRSVVSEPAAHITVRPCQAITAIPIGYYENSGTVSLSTCRPSRVPLQRNVLARRRCPIHVLQCSH